MLDGLQEVFPGDLVGDEGFAQFTQEDEADSSFGEFLVPGKGGHDCVGAKIKFEDKRESPVFMEAEKSGGVPGWEVGPLFGEIESGPHPQGDGLSVKEGAVFGSGFDGVPNGVSEIEKGAGARGFLLIFFHDPGLDRQVGSDEFGRDLLVIRVHGLEFGEHGSIPDGGVFDNLRESLTKYLGRKSSEDGGVDEDKARLVKGSQEVLSLLHVYSGFSAHRTIDLSDDGGGNLNEGDSPVKDGGYEPREVPDDAPSKGDHEAAPVVAMFDE